MAQKDAWDVQIDTTWPARYSGPDGTGDAYVSTQAAGLASKEGRIPVTDATFFQICSLSKPIAAVFALPYFEPIFHPDCQVHLGLPAASSADARSRVAQYLNGVFHPLRLDDIGARMRFYGIPAAAEFNVGPYLLKTLRMVHPGGTLGYRLSLNEQSVCYLTDTGPLADPDEGIIVGKQPTRMERDLIDLVQGTDLMIMDTTFDQDEFYQKRSWGHAFPEYAVAIAKAAGVKKVALFHHSPDATDDMLDELAAKWSDHTSPSVMVAKEGVVLDLEG